MAPRYGIIRAAMDNELSPDFPELLRTLLHKISSYNESLKLEIFALRKTLETYANPKNPSDPPLEETVTYLMKDPIVRKIVHSEFEQIARQIDDLVDQGKALQLLSLWTPEGPVH
jgi:hypothetical protein